MFTPRVPLLTEYLPDMDALLSNRNDTYDSLHSVGTESSRSSESTTAGAIGKEYQPRDIQCDQRQLGSTQHRPIRLQHKHQTTAIHVMATRPERGSSRCSPSTLDIPRSPIHLSTMELDPRVLQKLKQRKVQATIIVPNWSGTIWAPTIRNLATSHPILLSRSAVVDPKGKELGLLSKNPTWSLTSLSLGGAD